MDAAIRLRWLRGGAEVDGGFRDLGQGTVGFGFLTQTIFEFAKVPFGKHGLLTAGCPTNSTVQLHLPHTTDIHLTLSFSPISPYLTAS